MSDSYAAPRADRRRFLMLMGVAGIASIVTAPALAAEPTPGGAPKSAAPPDTSDANKPPSAEAMALAEYVKRRYGAKLSDADMKSIAEDLDGRLDTGKALHKLALANGDEPDFTFHA